MVANNKRRNLNVGKMKEVEKKLERIRQLLARRFNQLNKVLEQLKANKNEQSNSL